MPSRCTPSGPSGPRSSSRGSTSSVQLLQVDPSGTAFRGAGFAIGQHADEALEAIGRGYRPDLTLDDALRLATETIESSNGGKGQIEFGVVQADTRRFERRPLENGG